METHGTMGCNLASDCRGRMGGVRCRVWVVLLPMAVRRVWPMMEQPGKVGRVLTG